MQFAMWKISWNFVAIEWQIVVEDHLTSQVIKENDHSCSTEEKQNTPQSDDIYIFAQLVRHQLIDFFCFLNQGEINVKLFYQRSNCLCMEWLSPNSSFGHCQSPERRCHETLIFEDGIRWLFFWPLSYWCFTQFELHYALARTHRRKYSESHVSTSAIN